MRCFRDVMSVGVFICFTNIPSFVCKKKTFLYFLIDVMSLCSWSKNLFFTFLNFTLFQCNCRGKTSCPLNGSCQHKNLVYSGKVSTQDLKQNHLHYTGLTEHTFEDNKT